VRPVDASKFKYRDKLASKRRQRVQIWTGLIAVAIVAVVVAISYGLFYTPWLRIQTVAIEGLNDQHKAEVQQIVDRALDHKVLGMPVGRNLFFLSLNGLAGDMNQLNFLERFTIQKKYFHTLRLVGTERQAEGVWCFGSDCRYFDHGGTMWGEAAQSSGFLLLNVNDGRIASTSARTAVDQQFLKAIQLVVPVLNDQGIKTKEVIIPTDSFTEFDVVTNDGYPLKFSLDSDILGQLKVYQIFRDQKMSAEDGSVSGKKLQYIDLRFDGRVYYK